MSTARLVPPVDLDRDHWRGGSGDVVELVEFGDYQCPYSRMAYRHIQRVERELGPRMRFVFLRLPLTEIHPYALAAAGFAEAAARQGRFWELHDLLFHNQRHLEVDDLRAYAAAVGLDEQRLIADLEDRTGLWRRVQDDVEGARASGAQGTPTLFVDGVRHELAYDVDALDAALRRADEAAGRGS